MALHAVFELCIQFTSFRNIDLLHQGTYRIESQVYVHPEVEILYPTEAETENVLSPRQGIAPAAIQQHQRQHEASRPAAAATAAPAAAVAGTAAAAAGTATAANGGVVVLQQPPTYVLHNVASDWGDATVAAVPSVHFSSAAAAGGGGRKGASSLGGPPRGPSLVSGGGDGQIDAERNAFGSRPFMIKYRDEYVRRDEPLFRHSITFSN